MCYSSSKDFGRSVGKEAGKGEARTPAVRPEPKPEASPGPRVAAGESRVRDFINRRKARKAVPAAGRIREKV